MDLMMTFRKWDGQGTGFIDRAELAALLSRLSKEFTQESAESFIDSVMPKNNGKVDYKAFLKKIVPKEEHDAIDDEDKYMTRSPAGGFVISNSVPLKPPKDPTVMDNMLLFLPKAAVQELNLEPNMDDKGHKKEMWHGRVWELRGLLSLQHDAIMNRVSRLQAGISDERKKELEQKMDNPLLALRLKKLAARWKGAAFRKRCDLGFLDRLKWSNLRGTLVYCHGSGGCSWDNFRICRMTAGMGLLVVAPDGFAYPRETAMGQLRHKDCLPLKKATDDTDYWAGDILYASSASGSHTYSTKVDGVLEDPDGYRDLYEKCYQLRRSELHFTIQHLPLFVRTQGFFLGGTSEGAMTVARFDDQRYGKMLSGRFINSFSVEYCYFTPTPDAGELGGQLDVPTLNIIGTKDQYFGPVDSVAKLVAEDETKGYGDKNLTGNAYNTFKRQGVDNALVCVLEDGVHSPCKTHDNFLRELLDTFYTRPGSIYELDLVWKPDPSLASLIEVQQSTEKEDTTANVVQVFVPRMQFPQRMTRKEVETMRRYLDFRERMQAMMEKEAVEIHAEQKEVKGMLAGLRSKCKKNGGAGFKAEKHEVVAKKGNFRGDNYYHQDVCKTTSLRRLKHHK